MAQNTMYVSKNNSPQTTLTNEITATEQTIPVADVSKLPAAPNIVSIGSGDNIELVYYAGISGSTLTGCVRGYHGTTASIWYEDTPVYRAYTSYDHDTFKSNIEDLATNKLDKTGDGSSTTVTFTEAGTLANPATGESQATLWGKILKLFNSASGHDHNGTNSKKIAYANITGIPTFAETGWIPVSDTWTYASSTTITVPSGAGAKYAIGDKLKLTQSGSVKYFYVIKVENTLLTVTAGSNYAIADATISDVYYSKTDSPAGYPNSFNFTPEITAASGTLGSTSGSVIFSINGKLATFNIRIEITENDTGGGAITCTLPFNTPSTNYIFPSRENSVTGKLGQAIIANGFANFFAADNSYPGGDNYTLIASGTIII